MLMQLLTKTLKWWSGQESENHLEEIKFSLQAPKIVPQNNWDVGVKVKENMGGI